MPHSRNIRCGSGWFNVNVNCFFDYLDQIGEEIIVKTEGFSFDEVRTHNIYLEELIESAVNDYILFTVFGERIRNDKSIPILPNRSASAWQYVHYIFRTLLGESKDKSTWFELRKIQ